MVIEEFDIKTMLDNLETEPRTEQKRVLDGKSIGFIIVLVHHAEFQGESPSYLASILGKPSLSYVKKACEFCPKTIEMEEDGDLVKTIKPVLGDKEWTVVLFSDTPLITSSTIIESFLYASERELNVLKLERGYIFKTDYIKRVDRIFDVESVKKETDDFFVVKSQKDLAKAAAIMKDRVLTNLLNNGVQIIDPTSTYIESEVRIDKGAIIYPNAALMGDSHIGSKTIVGFGSIIKNSAIGKRCNIQNSYITNSAVLDSTLIESSRVEINSLIEKNCVIKHYSIISSSKIGANSKVSWSKIKGIKIDENSKIEN